MKSKYPVDDRKELALIAAMQHAESIVHYLLWNGCGKGKNCVGYFGESYSTYGVGKLELCDECITSVAKLNKKIKQCYAAYLVEFTKNKKIIDKHEAERIAHATETPDNGKPSIGRWGLGIMSIVSGGLPGTGRKRGA